MGPLAFQIEAVLTRPSDIDKTADRERLLSAISEAVKTDLPLDLDLDILRRIPALLRQHDFSIPIIIASSGERGERLRVAAAGRSRCFGIAVDLGTTNLVASLFDLKTMGKIGLMELPNPQTEIAADVLSRIYESMRGRGGELHHLIISGVNELIKGLCSANSIDSDDVFALVFAGNTIMTHYLLDLTVENVPMAPYVPAAHKIGFIKPSGLRIFANKEAVAYVFPNAGSYVGGDIVAGIMTSGLYRDKEPSLLIDVGTNVEIVAGCRDWIIVGAGAAGPALEGDIAGIGMRAQDGAIYEIEIENGSDGNPEVRYKTIGDKEPSGICGSGMIELVSELFRSGIIDQRGKFTGSSARIIELDGNRGFVIHKSAGKELVIRQTEIENFLRSKAALFASIQVLIRSIGLKFSDLHKVYVCGSFGAHINADKAVSIGMLPDIDRSRFEVLGNSSLAGAEMLLGDRDLPAEIERISSMITYREMNTDGEFLREFPAAMFLPHTDPKVLKA